MKYLEDVKEPGKFQVNGVGLNADEYDNLVLEKMRDSILQNEIHRLLNHYAERIVRVATDMEEVKFCRGAMDGLKALLDLKDGKKERVKIT